MRPGLMAGVFLGGVTLMAATVQDARACGGCFHRPTTQDATVVTDHRMVFAISPTQTTLYDQIEYTGSPSDFAWVLPIHGQVGVGVSSDLLFSVLDQTTQTTILAPPYPCTPCNCPARSGPTGGASGAADAAAFFGGEAGVTVLSQQVVGPYETVQLHPNNTSDTMALTSWLQANGYDVPTAIDPIIAAYVTEGFDFLAIKLVPGMGVQSMRPIAVTTTGAALSLPLRMVAAGTGASVGITLWVVSTGRYEPQNFSSFTIAASSLVWDWSVSSSNYTTLRSQKEQEFNNTAWQIESSLDVSPYTIESAVLQDPSASAYDAVPGADGGPGQTAIEVRSQDLNTLFPQGGSSVRITRMRGDLSQAALANDLLLQASADQSSLSNVYQATLSVNANCPVCNCGPGSSSGVPLDAGSPPSSSGAKSGGGATSGGGVIGGGSGATGSSSGLFTPPSSGNTSSGGNAGTSSASQSSGGGCSATSSEPAQAGLFAGLLGFIGLALWRARSRLAVTHRDESRR